MRTFAIPFEGYAEFWCKSRAMEVYLHCRGAAQNAENSGGICGNSSVGRAQPCQGWGREFESRFPLQNTTEQVIFGWPLILKNNTQHNTLTAKTRNRARGEAHSNSIIYAGRSLLWSAFLLCCGRFLCLAYIVLEMKQRQHRQAPSLLWTPREKIDTAKMRSMLLYYRAIPQ